MSFIDRKNAEPRRIMEFNKRFWVFVWSISSPLSLSLSLSLKSSPLFLLFAHSRSHGQQDILFPTPHICLFCSIIGYTYSLFYSASFLLPDLQSTVRMSFSNPLDFSFKISQDPYVVDLDLKNYYYTRRYWRRQTLLVVGKLTFCELHTWC